MNIHVYVHVSPLPSETFHFSSQQESMKITAVTGPPHTTTHIINTLPSPNCPKIRTKVPLADVLLPHSSIKLTARFEYAQKYSYTYIPAPFL